MTSFPVKMRLSDKTLRYLGLKCPKIFLRISTIETCSKISARRPFFEFRNKRTLAVYFISVSHMTVKNFQKLKILPVKRISSLKSIKGFFYTLFHIGTALDLVYHSMIPTYAYCSPMKMTTDEALRKVSLYAFLEIANVWSTSDSHPDRNINLKVFILNFG